jgi:hypothetical protein
MRLGAAVAELSSFGITARMKIARQIILGVGVAVSLIILLFPPLRSPTEYFTQPQLVDQQFVAVQISRFSAWRPDLARLQHGAVLRTEVDPGELLRELALVVVLLGAAYYWLPTFAEPAQEDTEAKSETPNL